MNTLENQNVGELILCKWQTKVDLIEDLMKVTAVLIMKLHPYELEVFVRSDNEGNPYAIGDRGELYIGSYCDSVIANKGKIKIENAATDVKWKDKLKYNNDMCCYIGQPIFYPNEDLFGTLCIFNQESRYFDEQDQQLIDHFRDSIESDLLAEYGILEPVYTANPPPINLLPM